MLCVVEWGERVGVGWITEFLKTGGQKKGAAVKQASSPPPTPPPHLNSHEWGRPTDSLVALVVGSFCYLRRQISLI